MRFQIIFIIASFIACATGSALAKDSDTKQTKSVSVKQFPFDGWDGKNLEYAVAIHTPDLSGKTKVEAENVRKAFVVNGLKAGVDFLLSLATFDASHLHILFRGPCKTLEQPLPRQFNIRQMTFDAAKSSCKGKGLPWTNNQYRRKFTTIRKNIKFHKPWNNHGMRHSFRL